MSTDNGSTMLKHYTTTIALHMYKYCYFFTDLILKRALTSHEDFFCTYISLSSANENPRSFNLSLYPSYSSSISCLK